MGIESERPLSVTEAKNRLRHVAEELPSGYVRRHPYTVLALAFAVGLLVGGSGSGRQLLARTMLKVL